MWWLFEDKTLSVVGLEILKMLQAGKVGETRVLLNLSKQTHYHRCPEGYELLLDIVHDRYIDLDAASTLVYYLFQKGHNQAHLENPIILSAVSIGKKNLVKCLLDRGTSVNFVSKDGYSLLFIAVEQNNIGMVDFLIENGAIIDIPDIKIALWNAVANAYSTEKKFVFDSLHRHGFVLNAEDARYEYLLFTAAMRGFTTLFEHLLSLGANPNMMYSQLQDLAWENFSSSSSKIGNITQQILGLPDDVSQSSSRSQSTFYSTPLLHIATAFGHKDIVQVLVNYRCDINIRDGTGHTALYVAVCNKNLEIIKLLLQAGLETRVEPLVLHEAVDTLDASIVEVLLENNTDTNFLDQDGFAPIHKAILKISILDEVYKLYDTIPFEEQAVNLKAAAIIRLLIKYGASVDLESKSKKTPVHLAILRQSSHILLMLMKEKANLKITTFDEHGNAVPTTALHFAATLEASAILHILLQNKELIDSEQYDGRTPLVIAVENESYLTTKYLVEHGANVAVKTPDGGNLLHVLAKRGNPLFDEIASKFIQNGVNVNERDDEGRTPLHVVNPYCRKLVQTLLKYGADINATCHKGLVPIEQISSTLSKHRIHWDKEYCVVHSLINHAIKLNILGLPVHPAYSPDDFITNTIGFYQAEACLMKTIKLDNTVYLYDIFKQWYDPLFVVNKSIMESLKSETLNSQIPYYIEFLRSFIKQCEARYEMLNTSEVWFHFILRTNPERLPELPNEITRKVLGFLTTNDLRSLIRCGESLGCKTAEDHNL